MDVEHNSVRWLTLGLQVVAGLFLFVVGVLAIQGRFVRVALHPYRMPSSSMEPALHCARPAPGCGADTADSFFVPRFHPSWTPSRGDVVAFKTPHEAKIKCGEGGTFVKRIIGLPGDRLQIRLINGAGYVYIDGKKLDEPYIQRSRRDIGPGKTYKVPPASYFTMGDNRAQSCDSRQWGSVPRENLIGPVVASYWPPARIGLR